MLKNLRENFKHLKWILWLVIAIFVAFVFVNWGMGSSRIDSDQNLAARAGGIRITTPDFEREYREAEDRYRQMYGKAFSPELVKAMNLPEQVLNGLIDQRLMQEEAERVGLKVTDAELTARILSMKDSQNRPIFVKDGMFVGEGAYRRALAGAGFTPAGFEALTRQQILLEKLNRFLTESVVIGDDDVEADFASRNVKAKVSYVLLAPPAASSPVSDAEAEAAFKQNPEPYLQPERRKAKYLLIETARLSASIPVSDAEIGAEYNANPQAYRKPEQIHARHILYKTNGTPAGDAVARARADAAARKLKAGADFAALAKAESEDPGSQASGGDLGTFGRGQMVKEFEDAAFAAAPGAIVGPVKTPFGYHVIQVLEKMPERVQPIFEVAAGIRARLTEQKAAETARQQARDLWARVQKLGRHPSDEDLRKLATGAVTFNETDYVARGEAPPGIGYNPPFDDALFRLSPGEVAPPVDTARGEAILKLVDIRKSGLPAFAEVRARVVADLTKKKRADAAAATLRDALASEKTLEGVAKKLGLKVETPAAFGRSGPVPGLGPARSVLDAAFSGNPGELKGPLSLGERGAIVLQVLERTPLDRAALQAQKESIRESLKSQKASQLLQALISRRRADLKVEINRELLKRFGSAS